MTSYDVQIAIGVWEKQTGEDKKEGRLFASLPQSSAIPAQRLFNELFKRARFTIETLYLLTRIHYAKNMSLPDLNDCLLRTVCVYKQGSVFQHESVVFTLRSASGNQFHVLVDRNLDFTSLLPCSFSSGSSFTDGSWKPAFDYARPIHTEEPPRQFYGETRVRTITLPNPPDQFQVNLLQLAVLLYTIGETNDGPKYHITKMNCFWFARTVCQAIWRLATDAQAEDRVMEDFHGNDSRMGKCLGIRLDGSGPQDDAQLGELIDRYRRTYTYCTDPQGTINMQPDLWGTGVFNPIDT